MDTFFSATLSRPPLERLLAWVLPTRGALISYHSRNIRSIFSGRYPCAGALPTKATSVSLSTTTEALMSKKEQVSARLDPEVRKVVEQVAEVERRPISNLIRNIVSDWPAARQHDGECASA
jgi:hypothetical protein